MPTPSKAYCCLEESGGGTSGGYTYGVLTNAQILAVVGAQDGNTAWSSDDNSPYTYFGGSWYSVGGGVLV